MKTRYYLAYGSNLNKEQMKYRCPDAVPVGTARLDGWRLLFRGSLTGAYLTIERSPGGSVPVGVWAVSEADEAKLDRYEGYPHFYYKTELPVTVTDAKTGKLTQVMAFVYIMHENRPMGFPSREYVETCMDGYRDFGFDRRILIDAIWAKENTNNEDD